MLEILLVVVALLLLWIVTILLRWSPWKTPEEQANSWRLLAVIIGVPTLVVLVGYLTH